MEQCIYGKPAEWAGDQIVCSANLSFSLQDKLKMLLGAQARLVIIIDTENVVGRTNTKSRAFVNKVFPGKYGKSYGAYCTSGEETRIKKE